MNLQVKLRKAFASECPELLERIRSTLDRFDSAADAVPTATWEETFRAAHSLKGAARVCDLPALEDIGSLMQNVFGQVRDGTLTLSGNDVATIRKAADVVERILKADFEEGDGSDFKTVTKALQNININSGETNNSDAQSPSKLRRTEQELTDESQTPSKIAHEHPEAAPLDSMLLEAFRIEYAEHLESIRKIFDENLGDQTERVLDQASINEVFRYAHSIKGAARVNNLREIESLAHALEHFFGQLRDGEQELTQNSESLVRKALDVIEDAAGAAFNGDPMPEVADVLNKLKPVSRLETVTTPDCSNRNSAPTDTEKVPKPTGLSSETTKSLRIEVKALDDILNTAGRLATICLEEERIMSGLKSFLADIKELREIASLSSTAADTEQLKTLQQFNDGLGSLFEHLSILSQKHDGSVWSRSRLSKELQTNIMNARFVPATSFFQPFRKMVRDLAHDEGKSVEVRLTGLDVEADRMVYQSLKDPLMHLLRNAISHGIETPELRKQSGKQETGFIGLHIQAFANQLEVRVEDDGSGINFERIAELGRKRGLIHSSDKPDQTRKDLAQLIFHPNFSTSSEVNEVSGRGMGMSIVHDAVTRLGGDITIEPRRGSGTIFKMTLPLSLATQKLIMVRARDQEYALPFAGLEELSRIERDSIRWIESRPFICRGSGIVPLVSLEQLLGFASSKIPEIDGLIKVAFLRRRGECLAIAVDEFLHMRDALVKELPGPAKGNDVVNGAIISENGSVSLVLNPIALMQYHKKEAKVVLEKTVSNEEPSASSIMVVDDSLTTRTLEKGLLESEGYNVLIAVDGIEGLSRLRGERVDLVVSDIEMPRMDGLRMLAEIKKDEAIREIPVILMSSVEDPIEIERGLNLGAEAYIVKRKFDHQELLETVKQFL